MGLEGAGLPHSVPNGRTLLDGLAVELTVEGFLADHESACGAQTPYHILQIFQPLS